MCVCNNKLCPNTAVSSSVSVLTVGTTDTLVIDIPAAVYRNGECITLVVAQDIPDAATVNMPVALSIGGVTTTVYPLVRCGCAPVTVCGIRSRGIYKAVVKTTADGANIRVVSGLSCAPTTRLAAIPVATTGA